MVFLDLLRGIAVAAMIAFHTADGWIRLDLRLGDTWTIIRSIGGLAAPLFVTLAGISLGFRNGSLIYLGKNEGRLIVQNVIRGLQIIALGYMLRLQMWFIDGGGIQYGTAWIAAGLLLSAYLSFYFGIDRVIAKPTMRSFGVLLISSLLFFAGAKIIMAYWPQRLPGLIRIDVLQAIGASLVIIAITGKFIGLFYQRFYIGIILGFMVAGATQLMGTLVPGPLPDAIAGYIAFWKPEFEKTPATFFPLFPWMAYAFVGASIGLYLQRARELNQLPRCVAILSVIGLMMMLSSCEYFPHVVRAIKEHPLLLYPIRVAYRIGAVLVVTGIAFQLSRSSFHRWLPFKTLGGASLLIYWVHLEFAFGIASKSISRGLEIQEWFYGFILLCAAMTTIAWLRIHTKEWLILPSIRSILALSHGKR